MKCIITRGRVTVPLATPHTLVPIAVSAEMTMKEEEAYQKK